MRLAALALSGVIALAAGAEANSKAVRDAKGESAPLRKNGRLDIIRAAAGHADGLLTHTVTVRKRINPDRGRERPILALNTRGGGRSDPEYQIFGSTIFRTRAKGDPKAVGEATLSSRGRSWTYSFDPAQIPGLRRYGWAAITTKGNAFDVAPARRYADHRV